MANWHILSGQLLKGEATLDKRKNCKQRIVDLCFGSVLTQLRYKLDYLLSYNTDIYYDANKW